MANKRNPHNLGQKIARLIQRMGRLYGMAMLVLLLFWLLTGEKFFFVRIFVNLFPAAFYPALILLPLLLILRAWRMVLILLPAAIACAILYAPALTPKPALPPSSAPEITVLSYNILAINRNFDALGAVILQSDADIVAIQEAHEGFQQYAETHLTDHYPYREAYLAPTVSRYEGRMILSKYPILDTQVEAGYARTILYLRAEIEVSGERIAVYNVHLHPPTPHWIFSTTARHGDLEVLLSHVAQDTLPVLIAGDFNMTDATADYRLMAAQYTDIYRERARAIGTSHPNGGFLFHPLRFFPSFIRIDYVFHDDNFTGVAAQVIRDGSSDHFPLLARLRLGD